MDASDLGDLMQKGIEKGTTLSEFKRDFDKIIQDTGWAYKGGKGWRTGVIFNTNLRTAYAAGQHEVMTDPDVLKARPYWRYVPSRSREKRPEQVGIFQFPLHRDTGCN
ncbi:MAG: hypothetical protein C4582_08990 [Desulfobacteraceae bacterium]|nr:MAG: hypothetical protein C4582_08990 [Desulfobacteraceae bacterium]